MSGGLEVMEGTHQNEKVGVKIWKKKEEQQQINISHTKQVGQTTKLSKKSNPSSEMLSYCTEWT
jgi:hypothetical protein